MLKNILLSIKIRTKRPPRVATCTAVGINIALLTVLGVFLIWDYHATIRTHIQEKKTTLQEEAQIILSSVQQISSHDVIQELQEFIDKTCGHMQESASPGHHIVVEMPLKTIQANSHGRASLEMFNAMKTAIQAGNSIGKINDKSIVVGFAGDNKVAVYVSEYLADVHRIGRDEVIRRIASILVVGLTLIVVVNLILHKYVAKPLNEMAYSIWRIGRGDLHTRMPDANTMELGLVADEFNNMAQALEDAEKQHALLLDKIAAQNKELEQFVYITSHDLRSPVVNIRGFASELFKSSEQLEKSIQDTKSHQELKQLVEFALGSDMRESISYITASALKMDNLIDGLLRLSRVGHAPLNNETLDINALLQKVIDTMKFQITSLGASITVDPLPKCLGDAAKINQVFSNLISNALKYLDPARKGAIYISGQIENGMAVYLIKDNGIGIPLQHQNKIFDVFHRVDPHSVVAGEGLGLSIVKRIIDRHEGSIRVESQPGIGSTFYVTLAAVVES